jgi:hypothetical protein
MANDVFPVSIPNVIARKQRVGPTPEPVFRNGIIRPASERNTPADAAPREKSDPPAEDEEDPVRAFPFFFCCSRSEVSRTNSRFVVCRADGGHTFLAARTNEVLQTPGAAQRFLGRCPVQR